MIIWALHGPEDTKIPPRWLRDAQKHAGAPETSQVLVRISLLLRSLELELIRLWIIERQASRRLEPCSSGQAHVRLMSAIYTHTYTGT